MPEFDAFVRAAIAARHARFIEKTHKAVGVLPTFAEKLRVTTSVLVAHT